MSCLLTWKWTSLLLLLLLQTSCSTATTITSMITRTNHRNETYVLMTRESDKTSFAEAQVRCGILGSMVWIRDEADQQFLQSLTSGREVWLGCQFMQGFLSGRKLTITDQSSMGSGYENWKKNEPRCSYFGECCAIQMDKTGKWLAYPCMAKAHILCRVKPAFLQEADALVDSTKAAILANGGTVPPEFAASEQQVNRLTASNDQLLANLTQRIVTLEQELQEMKQKYLQIIEEKNRQAIEHSDQNTQQLLQKISKMTRDFNGSIDSLTKQLIKKTG